jgi:hypothetical protein
MIFSIIAAVIAVIANGVEGSRDNAIRLKVLHVGV